MDFTPRPPVAFVLLDQPISLDARYIQSTLSDRHADVSFMAVADGTSDVLTIRASGLVVTVMQFERPIPAGWDATVERATAYWQGAREIFASHRAHLVVSALAGEPGRLESACHITAVIGALAEAYPACRAVLWDLVVAHAADTYSTLARSAFLPYPRLPSTLWVNFQPFRDDANTVGVLTLGLRAFVGREIEIDGPPSQFKRILERTEGLASYLMQHGDTLCDGDTIGVSETERITIRHAQSERFNGLPVLASTLSLD